jgi:hypothetical protein
MDINVLYLLGLYNNKQYNTMCTGKVWCEFKDKNCENGPLYTAVHMKR